MATINLGRIKPVFRGAYSGGTAYVVDDIVTSAGNTYICIQAHGAGTQAVTVTAYWSPLATKGTDGTDVGTTITTQGDVLYRDGSGLARLAAGTSGQFLKTSGAGANPVWATSGLAAQAVHTAATLTAVAGRAYPINTTSNACTITLPAGVVGDTIQFIDYAGTWDTNAVTFTANGSEKIKGSTDDKVCNQERQAVTINYVDATQGWVTSSTVNQSSTADALIPPPILVDFLVVAGGGGTANDNSGGGGAGGFRYQTGQEVTASAVYTATIGAGGAQGSGQGTRGGTSSFIGTGISVSSTGGGGASADGAVITSAGDGGSGGGGGQNTADGGDGNLGGYSPVEGYDGGRGAATVSRGGGGGGSSAIGADSSGTGAGGTGGAGTANSITGASVTYAGGGGGGGAQDSSSGAAGGAGGGGAGSTGTATATAGTNYLGGGAGGGGQAGTGAAGGIGIVIMRILTSKYSGTSTNAETPIVDGSYTILKWHSTGTYTA